MVLHVQLYVPQYILEKNICYNCILGREGDIFCVEYSSVADVIRLRYLFFDLWDFRECCILQ